MGSNKLKKKQLCEVLREAPNPLSDPTCTLVPSHQTPQPTPSSTYNQTLNPYGPLMNHL
jgi:hypothetical protein